MCVWSFAAASVAVSVCGRGLCICHSVLYDACVETSSCRAVCCRHLPGDAGEQTSGAHKESACNRRQPVYALTAGLDAQNRSVQATFCAMHQTQQAEEGCAVGVRIRWVMGFAERDGFAIDLHCAMSPFMLCVTRVCTL